MGLTWAFYNSVQSIPHETAPANINALKILVQSSFTSLPPKTLNGTFLTLQCCLHQIVECNGNNDYKLPHVSEKKPEGDEGSPLSIRVRDHHKFLTKKTANGGLVL